MIKQFEIAGKCIPKGRPRFTRRGYAYTDKRTRDYEAKVAYSLRAQNARIMTGPLRMRVVIYRKFLKSWTKSEVENAKKGRLQPVTRPDLDNCIKSILDGSQGVLFGDDSQIIDLHAIKTYGKVEKVVIEVEELGGES